MGNLNSAKTLRGQVSVRKNHIINGCFRLWERATSGTTSSSAYISDRWLISAGGTAVANTTRSSFTLGQTDVPGEPKYYHNTTLSTYTTLSTSYITMEQRIEGVRTLAGQPATLSFYAKRTSGVDANGLFIEFIQNFGTGGSSQVIFESTKINLTTSWQKFEIVIDVPSISSKTIGTDSYLSVRFWTHAGSNYNTYTSSLGTDGGYKSIALVQLEEGYKSSDFEERFISEEIALCQRYYFKTYPEGYFAGDSAIYSNMVGDKNQDGSSRSSVPFNFKFPVVMRDTPTVTMYSPLTGTSGEAVNTQSGFNPTGDYTINSIYNLSDTGIYALGFTDSISANDGYYVHIVAEAEL